MDAGCMVDLFFFSATTPWNVAVAEGNVVPCHFSLLPLYLSVHWHLVVDAGAYHFDHPD